MFYISYPTHKYSAKQDYTQLYSAIQSYNLRLYIAVKSHTQPYKATHSYTEM